MLDASAVEVSRLHFVQATIKLEGKPFSLKSYPMFKQIYAVEYPEIILKCGRQVGKTVTEHNLMLVESVAIPGFRHLYVSPSKEQTTRFSISKLGKVLSGSADLKALLLSGDYRCNVLHQLYGNTSEVFLSYAGDDADRIRGISCDRIHYDEIQDIPYDGVVPVINECLSRSAYKYITYAGTPKSTDNTIEYIWQNSTQNEWAVRCLNCNRWSFFVTLAGLGKRGIICLRCGKYLNPFNGAWIATNPGADIHGFHIPQVILPENNPSTARNQKDFEEKLKNWKRILRKRDSGEYSETAFLNEVMGVSTEGGSRLFGLSELQALCDSQYVMGDGQPGPYWQPQRYRTIVGGIDYGGNGQDGVSRTVLTIWGLEYSGKFRLLYYKIYPVENPVHTFDDLCKRLRVFNVRAVGADANGGDLPNSMLRETFGHEFVKPIHYCTQKSILVWDDVLHQGCYKGDRSALIDNFALFLRRENQPIIYPPESASDPLFKDMLNVFEEVTRSGRKIWQRHPKMPDDALHSQVYAWVAMKLVVGDMTWYTSQSEI